LHCWHDLLAHRRHRHQVHLKGCGIRLNIGLGEVPRRRAASVGDQNVDSTERLGGSVDEGLGTHPGGEISCDRNRARDFRLGFGQAFRRPAIDDDLAARIGERHRSREPKARGRRSYDCTFARDS